METEYTIWIGALWPPATTFMPFILLAHLTFVHTNFVRHSLVLLVEWIIMLSEKKSEMRNVNNAICDCFCSVSDIVNLRFAPRFYFFSFYSVLLLCYFGIDIPIVLRFVCGVTFIFVYFFSMWVTAPLVMTSTRERIFFIVSTIPSSIL